MKQYMPTCLYKGQNALINNKEVFKTLGKKCLIITSSSSFKLSGALDDLIKVFEEYNIEYDIYDKIEQNPTVMSCIEAGKIANKFKANFIVGIGGGSPLDAAKTAAIVATNPNIQEEEIYATLYTNKPLKLVLIGTTAGTGSEVTNVSVMTNIYGQKKSIHNDDIYATYAFGDVRYTLSMPKHIQISTAIDAFSHLLESYFNNNSNEISKAYSIQGIKLIYKNLVLLSKEQELTLDEKEEVYDASILGGLAINITGTSYPHALGYYFTENYCIPHGFATALFICSLIDYEYNNSKKYTEKLFTETNININECKETITKLLPEYNIQITSDEIEKIRIRYSDNKNIKNTYGNMNIEDIINILETNFNNNII